MARDDRLECFQSKRRFDRAVAAFAAGSVLAQRADELVDLADRLARHLLDRLERRACRSRIALLKQSRGARLNEDDVDRVAGRVVQVASDPRSLLGGGQLPFALTLALRTPRTLLHPSQPLSALSHLVAGDPRASPDDNCEQERRKREASLGDAGGAEMDCEQADDDGCCRADVRARLILRRDEEECDRRAERRAERVVQAVQERLAKVVTTRTASGERRRATSGQVAQAARKTPSVSRSRLEPWPSNARVAANAARAIAMSTASFRPRAMSRA